MQPFNLVKSIINGRVSLRRMFFVYSNDKSAAGYKTDKGYITEKYFDMVYRLALSQTKQQHYAEDVTQEVFLKFYKTDKSFESEEHAKAWLLRVTLNCSRDVFLNSWFKKTAPMSEADGKITFDTAEKSDIYYAVSELPQKYRAVIHLFYYEDYSVREIAELLKTKESTVKSQLSRGRDMLRDKLKGGAYFV